MLDTAEVQGTFGTVEKNLKRLRKLKFCVPNFSANKHFQKKINSEKDTYRTCAQNVWLKTQQDYAFAFQLHDPILSVFGRK